MKNSYTITDLSREFDVTPRSLRHYEDEGLLSPQRSGSARIYSTRDRVRLMLILRGKSIGFSLAEIKEILDLYDLPQGADLQSQVLRAKINRRREKLVQQQNDIAHMLTELDSIETRLNARVGK